MFKTKIIELELFMLQNIKHTEYFIVENSDDKSSNFFNFVNLILMLWQRVLKCAF